MNTLNYERKRFDSTTNTNNKIIKKNNKQKRMFLNKKFQPYHKQIKYQVGVSCVRKVSSSLVAQSVPDLSSLLRKENRKPVNNNMQPTTLTHQLKNKNKGYGVMSSSRGGSRSVNADKRKGCDGGCGILTARKNYGSFDELRSFSLATENSINGDIENSRVVRKRDVYLISFSFTR
ncbi:hypothetical protein RYX36_024328 [Vicia faba]